MKGLNKMKELAKIKSKLIKEILKKSKEYCNANLPVSAFWNYEMNSMDIQKQGENNYFLYVYLNKWSKQIELYEVWPNSPEPGIDERRIAVFNFDNIERVVEFTFDYLFVDLNPIEKKKIDWIKLGLWFFTLTGCGLIWYAFIEMLMTF